MEAIAHLLPESKVAAKSFAQYQLRNGGHVGCFQNRLGQRFNHVSLQQDQEGGNTSEWYTDVQTIRSTYCLAWLPTDTLRKTMEVQLIPDTTLKAIGISRPLDELYCCAFCSTVFRRRC